MALTQFLFEGQSDGTAATTGNSGASLVNKSGGTINFSAAAKSNGDTGLRITGTAGGSYTIARFLAAAPNNKVAFTGVFAYSGFATGTFIKIRQTASDAAVIGLSVKSNKFAVDAGNGQIGDTPGLVTLTQGTKYRVALVMTGGSTTAGKVTCNLYTATGTTPIYTISSTTADMTANMINGFEIGNTSSVAAAVVDWDDIQINDGATTEIPQIAGVAATTVRPTGVTSNPGAYFKVGQAADIPASLADESDTTYIQSVNGPSGAAITIDMDTLSATGDVTVKVRHQASLASPTVARTYALMQGATVITTKTVTLPAAWADYQFTTTPTETGTLAAPRNLSLRVTDTSA